MKACALIVVSGGVASDYAPNHVDVRIIDVDNIEAGDEPETLPRGIGFEHLVRTAGLKHGKHYRWEAKP